MKWFNLKKNKCPKCNKDWAFDLKMRGYLMKHGCGFVISKKRYTEIVTSMVDKDIEANEKSQKKSSMGSRFEGR